MVFDLQGFDEFLSSSLDLRTGSCLKKMMANPTACLLFTGFWVPVPVPNLFQPSCSYNQTGKYKIQLCNMKKQQKCRYKIGIRYYSIPMDPMDHSFILPLPIFSQSSFLLHRRLQTLGQNQESGRGTKHEEFHVLETFTLLGCPGQEGTGSKESVGDITRIYAIDK